jgi:hypothetical protein
MNIVLPEAPPAGSGVHRFIFRAACCGVEAKLPEFAIIDLIREKTRGCGRRVPVSEIRAAVIHAQSKTRSGSSYRRDPSTPEAPRWPKLDVAKRDLIAKHGIGGSELCDLSPSCTERSAEEFIDALFHDDPLLCLGLNEWKFATRRRSKWRGHCDRLSHIVPNPMSARKGKTMDGKWSERTRENTGERVYLVLDFDSGSIDDQAAIIWFLAQKRPLKMVVHSAHKSLHGWFKLGGVPEEAVLAFMTPQRKRWHTSCRSMMNTRFPLRRKVN